MEKTKLLSYIIGPDGRYINEANLPTGTHETCSMDDKASIVFAVEGGLLSARDAMSRYGMQRHDLKDWCKIVDFYFGSNGRVLGINPQHFKMRTLPKTIPSALSN